MRLLYWNGSARQPVRASACSSRWARVMMWPGMQLQKLTTREPDLSQLAVAIAALEAVLAVENPKAASDEDKIGMEVVA